MSGRDAIRIVDFSPRWRGDFARLNLDWLERLFVVEPVDREVLLDPEGQLLAGGGHVLFAVDGEDHAVGTVALLHHGDGLYEMTKMAVEPALHGQGIGRALALAALQDFRRRGGRELFLESSSKLLPALHLYAQLGFEHRAAPRPGSHYRRADVYMVWREPAGADVPAA